MGGEYIKERILLIFVLLIFFTSLGSAVASDDIISDNLTSDINLDDSGIVECSDDCSIGLDGSNNIDNPSNSSIENNDFIELNDDSCMDDSNRSDLNDGSGCEKLMSSTNDSREINSNDLSDADNSKHSKSLLSSAGIIYIQDASSYGNSLNELVQGIINSAAPGSTIQFIGSSYENLCLKISKPLNIISQSGTVITTIFNVPVFTITYGGSGTTISGFTVNLAGSFVDASDVSGITISNNQISTKRSGIVLTDVYDLAIQNNVFSKFDIAIDIFKSGGIVISNNAITPNNGENMGIRLRNTSSTKAISILNNNIIGFDKRKACTGIYFGNGARNVLIQGNVLKGWSTAIDMSNSINNVTMYNNTISENGDGIIINGWINGFTFKKNVVNYNSGVGILFDYDFSGTKGNLDIENNYFSYNGVLDLQNKGSEPVSIGKNFANRRCYRVGMKYGFNIRSRQSGGKYYFSVVDRFGNAVSDLPNFQAILTVNGKKYTVTFVDSKAYIDTGSGGNGGSGSGGSGNGNGGSSLDIGQDKRNFNKWGQYDEITEEEMSFYEQLYNKLLNPNYQSNSSDSEDEDEDYDSEYTNESGSSRSHSGSGDSGVSTGANSIRIGGDLSGSSGGGSSSSASSAGSSAVGADSGQASGSSGDGTTMKSLSVDDETFRVLGVGGLVFLIIFVIGLYYREDIIEMIKE